MKTEIDVRQSLRKWIAATNQKVALEQITDETPLIEQRIITSLQVMDLILYIEKLRGCRVEMEDLKPGVFRDLNSIYLSFFEVTA